MGMVEEVAIEDILNALIGKKLIVTSLRRKNISKELHDEWEKAGRQLVSLLWKYIKFYVGDKSLFVKYLSPYYFILFCFYKHN